MRGRPSLFGCGACRSTLRERGQRFPGFDVPEDTTVRMKHASKHRRGGVEVEYVCRGCGRRGKTTHPHPIRILAERRGFANEHELWLHLNAEERESRKV